MVFILFFHQVSPQFSNTNLRPLRKRTSRRVTSVDFKCVTRSRNKSGKENQTLNDVHHKYPALKFISEQPVPPDRSLDVSQNAAEDLSNSIDMEDAGGNNTSSLTNMVTGLQNIQLESPKFKMNLRKRTHSKADLNLSGDAHSVATTQRRPKKSRRKLDEMTRKLFDCSLNSPSVHRQGSMLHHRDKTGFLSPVCVKNSDKLNCTTLSKGLPIPSDFFQAKTLTPKRQPDLYNVLVYDTPEEDYGLTVRQRRLKYLKRKHKS